MKTIGKEKLMRKKRIMPVMAAALSGALMLSGCGSAAESWFFNIAVGTNPDHGGVNYTGGTCLDGAAADPDGGKNRRTGGLSYRDTYEKADGQWLIAHREATFVWTDTREVAFCFYDSFQGKSRTGHYPPKYKKIYGI